MLLISGHRYVVWHWLMVFTVQELIRLYHRANVFIVSIQYFQLHQTEGYRLAGKCKV